METLLLAGVAAIAVLLIVFGLFGGRSDVDARLKRYATGTPDAAKVAKGAKKGDRSSPIGDAIAASAAMMRVNKIVEKRDFGTNLARELARADLALKPSEFLAIRFAALIGLPMFLFLLGQVVATVNNPLIWLAGLVAGYWLPGFYLSRRKGGRLKAFNKQLADTITLIANALRSGSSFLQAVEMVVREGQPPISVEFSRVIREVNLGLAFEAALANMVRRVRSDDLELMTTAITVQHQVGGNLAEILDSIAFTIRERVRIKGEIKTLTAQTRLSGYVVGLLPLGLTGILFVIAPDFMSPMFRKPPEVMGLPAGMIIMAVGGFMMLIGFMAVRKIVDIEV
jgi:tight adherence protein B